MKFYKHLRISFPAVLLLIPALLFGQYYNLGQDPASLKWRQIITPHVKLIYPQNYEQKANYMVRTFEYVFENASKSLEYKPKQIPFIIHNFNSESNAVTVWAPKRVELFTTPPQDSYAQDWLNQLIIHEYRHVVQIERSNQGFTKVLSWLAGEQAAAAINGLFVPSWFMEGDAVCTETALSNSGRGRIPSFEMLLRAQVLEKGFYSYDKASMGSYKNFVPNQYVLGYSMVANVRRKYGYQAWVTALDEVARKPYVITPFSNGLKKATGYGKVSLYKSTMQEMDSMWKFQDSLTLKKSAAIMTKYEPGGYVNYKFPYFLNDSIVAAELSSLDDITRFVVIKYGGSKEVLITPGFLSSEHYSVSGKIFSEKFPRGEKINLTKSDLKVVWTETINDLRWGERTYSVIRIFDGKSGEINEMTKKSRFYAPALSPDGKNIAVVDVNPESIYSILLLNTETGETTDTILSSDSDFYMTPSWSEDGMKIIFTKLDKNGKSIIVYSLIDEHFEVVVPETFVEISNPVFAGRFALFNGSFSGIENIYSVNFQNKQVYQVTSSAFGACNADLSPNGKKLVYSDYSSDGYRLVEMEFNPDSWQPLSGVNDYSPSLYKHLIKEERASDLADFVSDSVYKSQPYKKGANIFNFHSWAPAYINYMSGENGLGISVMSQNNLSTATTVLGYKYDMTENTGKVTLDFKWQGWYPVIDINTSYGARTAYTDSSVRYNFNETILGGKVSLPLLFTGGKYYKGLNLQLGTSLINITNNTSPLEDKLTGTINTLDYSFYIYRYIKQSYKDLYPRWGQVFSIAYRHSPFGDNDLGDILAVTSRLYFPGILKHHGVRADINLQYRNTGTYYYSNLINIPRGYYVADAENMGCYALSYKFPFLYPDFSLGPFAYFKRFKANLFLDGGKYTSNSGKYTMQSTGVEFSSDIHFLRFVFPVDLGLRFGYRIIEKDYFFNLLFSVNLPD